MQYKKEDETEKNSVILWERSLLGWMPGRVLAEIPDVVIPVPPKLKCWDCDKRPPNICDCLLVGCE